MELTRLSDESGKLNKNEVFKITYPDGFEPEITITSGHVVDIMGQYTYSFYIQFQFPGIRVVNIAAMNNVYLYINHKSEPADGQWEIFTPNDIPMLELEIREDSPDVWLVVDNNRIIYKEYEEPEVLKVYNDFQQFNHKPRITYDEFVNKIKYDDIPEMAEYHLYKLLYGNRFKDDLLKLLG